MKNPQVLLMAQPEVRARNTAEMNSYAQQSQDRQGKAADNGYAKSDTASQSSVLDSRPTAVAQRALDESLNRSRKVQSQLQLQQMFDQSPHVAAQMKLAEVLSARSHTLQPQQPVQRQVTGEEAKAALPGSDGRFTDAFESRSQESEHARVGAAAQQATIAQPPVQLFSLGGLIRGAARTLGFGGGAYAGAKTGAALGSYLGPMGTVGGGILGGVLGGLAGYSGASALINLEQVPRMEEEFRAIRERQKPVTMSWQAWTDQQTRDLDTLEHQVYEWLNENRMTPGAKPFMIKVMNLQDRIQDEHLNVIDTVHQRDLNLWTPDRDQLSQNEQTNLQTAWNRLRAGNNRIQTPGGTGGGAPDQQLRAMHARLLSRPSGRALLQTLLDMDPNDVKNKTVTINYTAPDNRSAQQKKQVRDMRKRHRVVTRRLKDMPHTHPEYESLHDERRQLLGDIDDIGGGSEAAKAGPTNKNAANIFGSGAGSDARVDVREGTRDSDDLSSDRYGFAIPAPAFIQYGHELIHALHFRNAEDRSAEQIDQYRTTRWTDREEHQTIESLFPGAISENTLRDEHGITNRYGHSGGRSRDEL